MEADPLNPLVLQFSGNRLSLLLEEPSLAGQGLAEHLAAADLLLEGLADSGMHCNRVTQVFERDLLVERRLPRQ